MHSGLGTAHLEQTIQSEISFSGVGLHSGAMVAMRLVPAAAGSGIVFRRTDLDNFEIPATGRNVAKVSYATSLMRQSVLISDHRAPALRAHRLGVDNVIVEVDNLEVPILDGSALPYVQAFESIGLRRQRRRREYLRILKHVEVRDGSKFIGVYPGTGYGIDYTIDFPPPIGSETFVGDLASGDYARLIAPARTFGFREDEPMLRNMGLIRGASDACAIILSAGTACRTARCAFPTSSSATRSSTSSAISPSPAAASRAASSPSAPATPCTPPSSSASCATAPPGSSPTATTPRPNRTACTSPAPARRLKPQDPPTYPLPGLTFAFRRHRPRLQSLLPPLAPRPPTCTKPSAASPPSAASLATSSFLDTAPVGYLDQPHFLNAALLLETALPPLDLLHALLAIEQAMGRTRIGVPAKGPRIIDLDLLLYDSLVLTTPELALPHPAMAERLFVLVPLAEIQPHRIHPVTRLTIVNMLAHALNPQNPTEVL